VKNVSATRWLRGSPTACGAVSRARNGDRYGNAMLRDDTIPTDGAAGSGASSQAAPKAASKSPSETGLFSRAVADMDDLHSAAPPDLYTDSVRIGTNPYGLTIQFGLAADSPGEAKPVATIRMSPQHALVFSALLRQHLRAYTEQVGSISLPDQLFEDLGIDKDI
jgi:Protein of unknown function (DUF3467)